MLTTNQVPFIAQRRTQNGGEGLKAHSKGVEGSKAHSKGGRVRKRTT